MFLNEKIDKFLENHYAHTYANNNKFLLPLCYPRNKILENKTEQRIFHKAGSFMSNHSPFQDYLHLLYEIVSFMKSNKTQIKIYLQKIDEGNSSTLFHLIEKFDEIFQDNIERIYGLIDCYPEFRSKEDLSDDGGDYD